MVRNRKMNSIHLIVSLKFKTKNRSSCYTHTHRLQAITPHNVCSALGGGGGGGGRGLFSSILLHWGISQKVLGDVITASVIGFGGYHERTWEEI